MLAIILLQQRTVPVSVMGMDYSNRCVRVLQAMENGHCRISKFARGHIHYTDDGGYIEIIKE